MSDRGELISSGRESGVAGREVRFAGLSSVRLPQRWAGRVYGCNETVCLGGGRLENRIY